jgi:prepilin-type N-terminal cleavage/methylation domain-containing protein/prepilin-type processing-associated H-X9-DG protein
MSTQSKRGFTLIELLVVIAIIAILASILFPIFAKAREKARQTTCTSNLRQLAMAVTMYVQDNKSRFPGVYPLNSDGSVGSTYGGWASNVINYVVGGGSSTTASISNNALFYCPSCAQADISMPICYGFSNQLLKPDGTGVNEAAVKQPSQVGVMCDADPPVPMLSAIASDPFGGGIVGGFSMVFQGDINNLASKLSVSPAPRHNKGTVIGYADGHAKICPDEFNINDSSNVTTRSFYMCTALNLVDNAAAGLGGPSTVNSPNGPYGQTSSAWNTIYTSGTYNDFVMIGGDYVTRPLLQALCEARKKATSGFNYSDDGFTGSLINDTDHPTEYVQGNATGYARMSLPLTNVITNNPGTPIPWSNTANSVVNLTTPGLVWGLNNNIGGSNCGSQTASAGPDVYLGSDAMVCIVNNASTINLTTGTYQGASQSAVNGTPTGAVAVNMSTKVTPTSPTRPASTVSINLGQLQDIFNSDGYDNYVFGATPSTSGHDFQVYLLNPTDGTRAFLAAPLPGVPAAAPNLTPRGGYGLSIPDGFCGVGNNTNYKGTYCVNDQDIVDKVAGDPLGIGIVSASVADRNRVTIVAINYAYGPPPNGVNTPVWQTFPTSSSKVVQVSTTSTTGTQGCGVYPITTASSTYAALNAPVAAAAAPAPPWLYVPPTGNKIPSLASGGLSSLPIGMTISQWPFTRALFAEGFSSTAAAPTEAASAAYGVLQPLNASLASVIAATPGANAGTSFFKSPLFRASFFTQ